MTYKGSRTIYAVNYSTGEMKHLVLPYTAERLAVFGNTLFVTQLKTNHNTGKPLSGAFVEVNTQTFTLKKVVDINTDPYGITVDPNGYVYISSGSDQWGSLKAYSFEGVEVISNPVFANIRMQSNIFYNPQISKLYSISTDISPRDVDGFEVSNGNIIRHYSSPYYGEHVLMPDAKITPDGASMYNNSGVVFHLQPSQSGDMNYAFSLSKRYNDYAFSTKNQLTYAARTYGGIDVYQYGTNKYLYTICNDLQIQKIFYQNGLILALYSDNNGNYFVKSIDANTTGTSDVSPAPSDPAQPIDFSYAQTFIDDSNDLARDFYDDLLDGTQNVGLDSTFFIHFNQDRINVNDHTKISLKGPSGFVAIYLSPSNGVWGITDGIKIVPYQHQLLSPDANYTLTIQKGAIGGYPNDLVLHFKTGSYWKKLNNGKTRFYYNAYTMKHYLNGWQTISGARYYFNSAGEMQTGWNTIKGAQYYFDSSGKMKTGWLTVGGKKYYFNASGVMQKGWLKLGSDWYFFDKTTGAMRTGWIKDGKNWYYFYSNGKMAHDTKIGKYRVGHNGAML